MGAERQGGRDQGGSEQRAARVLFVNHTAQRGGAERILEQLVMGLPVSARVACLSPGPLQDRLAEQGVAAFVVAGGNGLVGVGTQTSLLSRLWAARHMPGIVSRLAREARQADVVYANSKKALIFAALAARRARRPLIWHQHDEMHVPSSLPLRGRLSEALLIKLLNRTAARVISVSQAVASTFLAAGGRSDLPIVIYNGVDASKYGPRVDGWRVRREAGMPEAEAVVGCFGRLAAWKGQSVLIEALAELPGVHAAVVGGVLFGEPGYPAALRTLAAQRGVAERVHFLGHRDDVAQLMGAVDVVVHTSVQFEPFGLVIVEGMLSERPVIATAVGGVPELLEDGESGLLVPPGDARALAGALRRVLADTTLRARLAEGGHRRALERFTLERMVRDVSRVISQVTGAEG